MSSNLVQNASKQASTDCGLASCQDGAMIYAGNRNIWFRSKPAELSNNLDKKECETAVHVEVTFFANQSSKYNSIFAHLCFQYLLVIRYANAPDTINTRRHVDIFICLLNRYQMSNAWVSLHLCCQKQKMLKIRLTASACKYFPLHQSTADEAHNGEFLGYNMRSVENTQRWVGHNAARHNGTLVRPSSKIRRLHGQLQIKKKKPKSGFSYYVSHCLSLSHLNGNDPQKCSCIKQSTNLDLLRGNVKISENAANLARIPEMPNDSGCVYCWQICSCVFYLLTDGITQSPGHTDAQITKYPTPIDGGKGGDTCFNSCHY